MIFYFVLSCCKNMVYITFLRYVFFVYVSKCGFGCALMVEVILEAESMLSLTIFILKLFKMLLSIRLSS